MAKEITAWLGKKEKDYDAGIVLLMKHSKNRILIQRLSRKPWPDKLAYELQKIVDRTKSAKQLKKEAKEAAELQKAAEKKLLEQDDEHVITDPKQRKIIIREQEVKFDDLPKHLQDKWKENADMYKESRSLHEKLKLLKDADPTVRKPLIERLALLSTTVRTNWDLIDNYDPDAKPEEVKKDDTIIDHKRINANRTYITRNLKKVIANPKDPAFAKIQERITELVKAGQEFKADQANRLKELKFDLGE